jgi:hypothetical protein
MFFILLMCTCWFIRGFSYSYINPWQGNFEIYPSQSRVSKANVVKWMVSKKGIKFLAWRIWMGGYIYVCASVWPQEKVLITFDGMNKSWWNFQDHSNSVQVIFGWGC